METVDLEVATRGFEANAPETHADPPGEHGDQLPNVEEYKAQVAGLGLGPPAKNKSWGCLKWMLIVVMPLLLLGGAIGVGVALAGTDENPTINQENVDVETQPTVVRSRVYDVADFVAARQWSSEVAVNKPGTPQWEAAEWIADFDRAKLPIDDSVEFKQRYILAVFYFSLDGADWFQQLEFLSRENVCDWNEIWQSDSIGVQVGASCNGGGANLVTNLFIPANQLKGKLPEEIGLLESLVEINLYENKIDGSIPESFKRLTNLRSLTLHDNLLDGVLPNIFGKMNLILLNVANNNITGELPTSIENMASLLTLNLAENDIEVDIGYLAFLTNIQALFLQGNRVYGQLGDWIQIQWPKIEVLDLSDNLILGPLPDTLFRHPSLVIVDLHNNQFSGPLLIDEGSQLSTIMFLALQENQLSGPISPFISYMTNLNHLDLSSNLLNGAIPEAMFTLPGLVYLFLAYNNFEPGAIPVSIGGMASLVDLSLKKTNRIGQIPNTIGQLSKLVLLDLDDNLLTGEIPESIGGMDNLTFLFLQKNGLVGEIPMSFSNLQKLSILLLNQNSLTGPAEAICAPRLPTIVTFVGDCVKPDEVSFPIPVDTIELDCPCCTLCCQDSSPSCNNLEWFGDLDPIWEYKYARRAYRFNEDLIVVPVVDADVDTEFIMPVP